MLYSKKDKNRQNQNIPDDYRSPFRRDYARIVHSPSFRRLQGKTQLFPGRESDFFRNRLTHSLEVAQIAKSIGQYISYKYRIDIDEDILECAGLAHDLGHPPFGHNGEKALDFCMHEYGGFEGNAQTLRILTKLDKKIKECDCSSGIDEKQTDKRRGLNLTARTLGSILKYDNEISVKLDKRFYIDRKTGIKKKIEDGYKVCADRTVKNKDGEILGYFKLEKGYYECDRDVVKFIKENTLLNSITDKYKTIECQIMDIADDIAYSTYDLEDAFKAEFLQPIDLAFADDKTKSEICKKMESSIDEKEVGKILLLTFLHLFDIDLEKLEVNKRFEISPAAFIDRINTTYLRSKHTCQDGYERLNQTSFLVDSFIKGISMDNIDKKNPCLSKILIDKEVKKQIEILKHFTYIKIIESPMLKISEFRGYDIVKNIFKAIKQNLSLLPLDFKLIYDKVNEKEKYRVICDFIAGMTDRYALEFHGRCYSDNPESIFKPF